MSRRGEFEPPTDNYAESIAPKTMETLLATPQTRGGTLKAVNALLNGEQPEPENKKYAYMLGFEDDTKSEGFR